MNNFKQIVTEVKMNNFKQIAVGLTFLFLACILIASVSTFILITETCQYANYVPATLAIGYAILALFFGIGAILLWKLE